jgi:hypothetical protein
MANSTQAKQTKNAPAQQPAKSDSLFPPTKLGAHQFTINSRQGSSRHTKTMSLKLGRSSLLRTSPFKTQELQI